MKMVKHTLIEEYNCFRLRTARLRLMEGGSHAQRCRKRGKREREERDFQGPLPSLSLTFLFPGLEILLLLLPFFGTTFSLNI